MISFTMFSAALEEDEGDGAEMEGEGGFDIGVAGGSVTSGIGGISAISSFRASVLCGWSRRTARRSIFLSALAIIRVYRGTYL